MLFRSQQAFASPTQLQYQGRILKSNGAALEYSNVAFVFQITDPTGQCLIYQEQVSGINMVNSGGVFDVPIGNGTVQYPLAAISVLDAFNNTSSFTCGTCSVVSGSYSCANGTSTYNATNGDNRKLRVSFYDGSGWQTISPDSVIRSVPYAGYALSAQKLGNYVANDFLIKTGLPTCASGTYLRWDGANLVCEGVAGSNGGMVTNVTSANSYLSIANGTSTPALTLNVGTTANTVAAGNDSRITGAIQSGAAASGDLSGTLPGPSVVAIRGVGVANTAPTAGQVLKFSGTTWAPASLATSDISGISGYLTQSAFNAYVASASCTTTQTMYWNSVSGTFACQNISVAASALPAFTGDVTSSAGSASLTLASVGTAGTYYKVTTDAKGRVTSGAASLVAADIPSLDWTKITSGKPTNLSGYGITDAVSNAGGTPSIQTGVDASKPRSEEHTSELQSH